MPSPIAHAAAGWALARAAAPGPGVPARRLLAAALFFSLLPDADVIPGWIAGDLDGYHNQATHSLAFGLAACWAGAALLRPWIPGLGRGRLLGLLACCTGAHLLMDWMTVGRGVMLFWPFSSRRFAAPFPLFYGLRHSEGVFSAHHAVTALNEGALIAAGLLFARLRRRRHRPE